MTIPATVTTQLAELQAAFDAASPIDTAATRAQVLGLQFRAHQLIGTLDAALPAAAGSLDSFDAAGMMPAEMVAGVLALLDAATTQAALAEMRGVIGRAEHNLKLVQGA